MPLPWTSSCQRIPRVEHRAITIQQLRDLHVFIQRLCKTRLLRSPDDNPISVFDVNMFHIVQHIVKPVIQFEEDRQGSRQRCSWVEFVATKQQLTPDVMFSHSWEGRFHDFMAVVNKLAQSRGFGGNVAIWVCTFANSQFGECFGPSLRDSPFYKAIEIAKDVLLVVDRDASSLQRIWCGFELHVTMKMQQPLTIFTSMGQVGVDVTTGPLIEAIEAWDVRRMEASQDTDRRQILNYLSCGELCEKQGLHTDKHGNFLLVDRWRKQLDSEELVADAPRRLSGRQEFAHEAGLFQRHAESFEELNMAVRAKVLQATRACAGGCSKEPCKIPCLTQRGITLGEARTCVKRLKALSAAQGGRSWGDLTVQEVVRGLLEPLTPEGFCYAEVLSDGPRTPQYIIDEAWCSGFRYTVSAIEWAAEALQLPDSAVLFCRVFCVDSRTMEEECETWQSDVETLIQNSYGWITVLPPSSSNDIIRSIRMLQLSLCFKHARPIYFACMNGILAGLKPFTDSSWEFGNFDPAVARVMLDADWEGAQSCNKMVEERVRKMVYALPGGFPGFSARLSSAAAGPVLRHVVLTSSGPGDVHAVEALCGRRGLKINSQLMKGALGETPLHIAAAAGNVLAMEVLLAFKADPNAEDHILETPLHYAALSGMAASARVLLMHGAIAEVESAFSETPLRVARQNPAGFLGRDTGRVIALLEAWEAAQEGGLCCNVGKQKSLVATTVK